MDIFEFIVGMISVILALAIAQLFIGVSDLNQRRERVKFFFPHSVWATVLFLGAFLHWWSLWTFKDQDWNFAMFFLQLAWPKPDVLRYNYPEPARPGERTHLILQNISWKAVTTSLV